MNGRGEVVDTDRDRDPEFMRAAAVSLGTVGVLTAITLRLEPAFRLSRKEYFVPLRTYLALWDELREEPRCTSRDELCILNTSSRDAEIRLTVYFEEAPPHGPHELEVSAERLRVVRMNDLIDPLPIPLRVAYGVVLESNVPVAVQMQRIDTSPESLPTLVLAATPL